MTSVKISPSLFLKSLVVTGVVLLFLCGTLRPCNAYDLTGRVKEFTLENGLKVLIVERHTGPTVSLYISHPAGAADEENGHTGTAHILEHMMFKGTETIGTKNFEEEKRILRMIHDVGNALDTELMKGDSADRQKIEDLRKQLETLQREAGKWSIPSEIDRLYTEKGGGDLNASTGQDLTTYHVSLPSNRIELWARIESDRMTNPVFREFYSERDVVMEERKQTVESNPGRKLMEQFLAAAFMVHPYRRPVLGWAPDMRFLNIDYTKEFFRTYYAPNNTTIVIVGDVSPDRVMKIIKRYFGRIPSQKIPVRRVTEEPPQNGERRVKLISDAAPRLIIGYHKPTLPSFDDCVFDVIDTILSGGRTSRLFKALVEKGIAVGVNTANGFPGARYPNLFVIFAEPVSPHTCGKLEEIIYKELDILKKEPAKPKELEKAKNKLKTDLLRGLSTNSGLAGMLSYYGAVAGDWRYITTFLDLLERVTPEDVMAAAKKYFEPRNRTVAELVRDE
ncbi:putative zinc protease [subsurface metagenome]